MSEKLRLVPPVGPGPQRYVETKVGGAPPTHVLPQNWYRSVLLTSSVALRQAVQNPTCNEEVLLAGAVKESPHGFPNNMDIQCFLCAYHMSECTLTQQIKHLRSKGLQVSTDLLVGACHERIHRKQPVLAEAGNKKGSLPEWIHLDCMCSKCVLG